MTRSAAPRVWIIAGLMTLVALNALVFHSRLTAWMSDQTGRLVSPAARRVAGLRDFVGTFVRRIDLARENLQLSDRVAQMQSQFAGQEDLRRQLEFYREAAGIREHTGTQPIEAGIFSYTQGTGTQQLVINRGSTDWVAVGDVVITSRGELVGMVTQVFDRHSIVRGVDDVASQVTVRISGSEVAGLLRSTRTGGLVIDLVQQSEVVAEGSQIVTSGDDRYPAGLTVGTVRAVDNDAATLFKIVHVNPAVHSGIRGSVLVVRP